MEGSGSEYDLYPELVKYGDHFFIIKLTVKFELEKDRYR
jgi:hypothetical protein